MRRKHLEKIIIILSLVISLTIIILGLSSKWISNQSNNSLANSYRPSSTKNLEPQWVKKLNSGEAINAVIIGDGIARSCGCSSSNFTWHYKLTEKIKQVTPNDTINWHIKAVSGSNVQAGILQLKEIPKDTDIVFICSGRNDVQYLSAQDFKNSYDNLIKHIKSNYQAEPFLSQPRATDMW